MKKMRKWAAVVLALAMTMALGMTTFAAEVAAAKKGSLTVNVKGNNNTLENQTIHLYKLFDLTVSGSGTDTKYAYTVNTKYADILKQVLNITEENPTDVDYYDAIAALGKNEPAVQKFADDFTAKALEGNVTSDRNSGKLGRDVTKHVFADVEYGYYLVYQTGTKELQSSLISVDKASVDVNLKGEAPSIEKTANAETVEIGQVITYTIKGSIPDTTGYNEYVYTIKDTLTSGLDFVEDAQGKQPEGTNYNVAVQIADGQSATKVATLSGEGNRTMTLDLSQWVRENQGSKGKNFTVTYYAKVNANAVVTEKNNATLEYGNKPEDTTTTKPSEVKTPTFPLQISKTDTNDVKLAGATFRLYTDKTNAEAANDNAIKVSGENGNYVVDATSSNMDIVSVEEITGKGYNLRLNGLKAGTYYLVETKAPEGYNKLVKPIEITIQKSATETVKEWTISKGEKVEEDKIIDIQNNAGTILPETGGMGTILFTGIAIILIVGVMISFAVSRRKR